MHKSLEFAFFLSPVRLSFSFPSFSEVIFPLSHGHSFNANISYDVGMHGKVFSVQISRSLDVQYVPCLRFRGQGHVSFGIVPAALLGLW